jgi:hypothetical protein
LLYTPEALRSIPIYFGVLYKSNNRTGPLDNCRNLFYTGTIEKEIKMNYAIVVYNSKGVEVYREIVEGVSATFMHEIYKDYAYLGGKGGWADFEPV